MTLWNYADVWETIADTIPDAPAQTHGSRRVTWAESDVRADGVARALVDAGLQQQDKVAQYLYNAPEYLESMFACFKAGLVPVNTNYRYREDELVYLWDNADVRAVVFHGTFAPTIEAVRSRVAAVKTWLWVDDGMDACPDWAVAYEDAATANPGRTVAPWGRSGEDIFLLYTGGTTGMPKGVMWRQHDVWRAYSRPSSLVQRLGLPGPIDSEEQDLAAVRARVVGPGLVVLPACPLMHGTGMLTGINAWRGAGCVVTLTARRFDAVELLDTVARDRVNAMSIVGDPFARPMVEALDAEPGRWDLSSLVYIVSSGAMWSESVKQGLLRHKPELFLADAFGSSEALGMGNSLTTAGDVQATARFEVGEFARVVTDDGRDVVPGSGEVGMVAVGGELPLGYYKDAEKSERTFRVIDGRRYSIPGDFATVDADARIVLLGRGNVCINTGGEKVFPEEVEEALKEHPAVVDAVVVGVPDERFGEAVTGVVEAKPDTNEADLIAHVKGRLASYKAPRHIVFVESLARSPSGKADYARLKRDAARAVSPKAT
jgi:acyl-CoA synthetase (AMP-forming)/AMP-acid ligase II